MKANPVYTQYGPDLLSLADLSHSMSNCHLSNTSLVSRHVITKTSFCTVHSNSHSATHIHKKLFNYHLVNKYKYIIQGKNFTQFNHKSVLNIRSTVALMILHLFISFLNGYCILNSGQNCLQLNKRLILVRGPETLTKTVNINSRHKFYNPVKKSKI